MSLAASEFPLMELLLRPDDTVMHFSGTAPPSAPDSGTQWGSGSCLNRTIQF